MLQSDHTMFIPAFFNQRAQAPWGALEKCLNIAQKLYTIQRVDNALYKATFFYILNQYNLLAAGILTNNCTIALVV